ncbi:hypothetical protein PRIPAC_91350 [Pristionchus pacificus]|uniref:Uncharacterized protein n=1 Tax=Pristionchus pacificus TaxID=54126 RepID=A0A2A6B7X9_PRIPA|nr:hypothetical protein PRIPAC_91350 [Pristionchus pacificus]|eukprot:PDM61982.1 hypothetical protein PRIPAC_51424 [Pristionchus pacificus]
MMSSEEAADLLHHISHNVLTVFSLITVVVEVRLLYVIFAKRSRIPSLFRIIILHILVSHIGITTFQLIHFTIDRVLVIDPRIKQRPSIFLIGNETSAVVLSYEKSEIEEEFWPHCDGLGTVYWTERRLMMNCSYVWIFATLTMLIGIRHMGWYFNATKGLVLTFSIMLVILYLVTLAYWKLIKIEYRSSIPQAVLRTTIACFALSSVDIISNILALYVFFSAPSSRDLLDFIDFEAEFDDNTWRSLWTEIIQVTRQLREILFPILLIALFRKVRWLFLGRPPNGSSTKSPRQTHSGGSVQTRVVDSHSPLINRTSV